MAKMVSSRKKSELFAALPPEWDDPELFAEIQKAVRRSGRTIVVLDDDPTGTQTVCDVDILTDWSVEPLRREFQHRATVFFILTNSRSLSEEEARDRNVEIAANLAKAARGEKREFDVVSRSDSTLRGHYPTEIDALAEVLARESGVPFDGHILLPFFAEGRRWTVHDVHWVEEGEMLVPVGQTEYARDHAFGFSSSDLREWVEEKTKGRHRAEDVVSISLDAIRQGGPEEVTRILGNVRGGIPVVVNCAGYRDLEAFVAGLLRAQEAGKRFLFRTAASFVKVRSGIGDRALLTARDLYPKADQPRGGLVVVGSYIQKSSGQLAKARALTAVRSMELNVARALDAGTRNAEIDSVARAASEAIATGETAVVFTSRAHFAGDRATGSLEIGRRISWALTEMVRRIPVEPRFIVAKGGITSSDTATEGLAVRRACVLGQIAPGVPVWRLGPESRFPGVPYVVFPGNVGAPDTLANVIEMLRS